MSHQLPPLVWLRAFESAARLSSFTAAAVELNLTQAAVSHQVRSLERYLGFSLFERLPRSLRLTDMGRAYLPTLRKAFDDISAATAGLFGPMGEKSVTVRAPVSYAVLCLAPRLHSFRRAYPEIDVRLCSAIWADALETETADVDIRYGDGHWPGFDAEFIFNEPAVPVCSPEFPEARGPAAHVLELARRDIIHIMGAEDLWTRLLRSIGSVETVTARGMKVDTSLAAAELAATGMGCALLLRSFAAPYVKDGRLIVPVDIELPLEQSHYLLLPHGQERARPEVLLFQEWLLDEFRSGR
ncbi:MAG: LysR substrate-binding domain-containing protein [Alphaproteobacteria bacterium]|nr:LysR substrate-binding domain-containing protein [Alphaproteobacteria bacterium]